MTNAAVKQRKPFAFQAAIVAVLAPALGVALSMGTQTTLREQRSLVATGIVAVVCLAFLVVGFVCSIIALLGIPRHGRKGLLGRGLVGLAFNGLFLWGSVYILFFNPWESLYPKYVGLWTVEKASGSVEQLELQPDRQFHLMMTGTVVADVTGEWRLQFDNGSKNLFLMLTATHIADGAKQMEGKTIVMQVDRLEPDALHVITADGPVTYRRKRTSTP